MHIEETASFLDIIQENPDTTETVNVPVCTRVNFCIHILYQYTTTALQS